MMASEALDMQKRMGMHMQLLPPNAGPQRTHPRRPKHFPFGRQKNCVQCGVNFREIRLSQRRSEPLACGYEDYNGDLGSEWPKHKFNWSASDQRRWERAEDRMRGMEEQGVNLWG